MIQKTTGYFALVLHAHLPFVRHPEHERFLEEQWLFEAITETYLPLIQLLERWERDGVRPRLTLSVSPTLLAMLRDVLLQERYQRHLEGLIELAGREEYRTHFDLALRPLAEMYVRRFRSFSATYRKYGGDLAGAWKAFQDRGLLELITCSATHAILPLLVRHPASLWAQLAVARDAYHEEFGGYPQGIWLPECAFTPEISDALKRAGFRWFILETHGIIDARPRPRHGVYAPVLTREGLAAFGRDRASAERVWSRESGYPGDPRYRDFYRDIAFDLDLEYLRPYLPAPGIRTFTGIKYYGITGSTPHKAVYHQSAALAAAAGHAHHLFESLKSQIRRAGAGMDRPPLVLAPFDAELFGHWWYEGIEFLDFFIREAASRDSEVELVTPSDYLRRHPVNQIATPAASSWGEGGYWQVWLNKKNAWVQPHLQIAQCRMEELARRFKGQGGLVDRALRQAGRELLLAQASDWLFMLRAGTASEYAQKRLREHLARFNMLDHQLRSGEVNAEELRVIEGKDNLFPHLPYAYWAE
jgi:1,4-alpha-glucan branching enzyme